MSLPQHKGLPTGAMNPNKLAMSKALGAAFLNHQVEQLEKTVTNGGGNSVGNWRNRGRSPAQPHGAPAMSGKRPPMAPGIKVASRKPEESQAARKAARAQQSREATAGVKHEAVQHVSKRSVDEDKHEKKQGKNGKEKDGDIVVVDASVLVHALYQLKKWCRDGREEVIIVPLEALNTLDLLKKGSNNLAQRARAASRLLEAQVGTNPRIRVQQDDAYVPWDKIKFNEDPISVGTDANQLSTSPNSKAGPISNTMSPEWIRRTICCAVWEVQNATSTLAQTSQSSSSASPPKTSPLDNKAVEAAANPSQPASVLLAVLRPSDPSDPRGAPGHAPKNSDSSTDGVAHLEPVVPLPAPSLPPQNKFEPRAAGSLVSQWAKKAGMKLIELDPTTPGKGESAGAGGLEDTPARPKHISPRPPPNTHGHGPIHGPAHGMGPGRARRVSAAADVAHAFGHKKGHSGGAETGLVERPPAVRTMMEMVAQPKTVVRVLARGEKLDP